jgi:hypothetical protein
MLQFFSLGVMFNQKKENTIDRPTSYASRLMTSIKKKLHHTSKKTLAMIYVVKCFWHYLLGDAFIFFVDHHA